MKKRRLLVVEEDKKNDLNQKNLHRSQAPIFFIKDNDKHLLEVVKRREELKKKKGEDNDKGVKK